MTLHDIESPHLSEEDRTHYVLGWLDEGGRVRCEQHLARCESCLQEVAELDGARSAIALPGLSRRLDAISRRAIDRLRRRPRRDWPMATRLAAVAAVVTLVVGVGFFYRLVLSSAIPFGAEEARSSQSDHRGEVISTLDQVFLELEELRCRSDREPVSLRLAGDGRVSAATWTGSPPPESGERGPSAASAPGSQVIAAAETEPGMAPGVDDSSGDADSPGPTPELRSATMDPVGSDAPAVGVRVASVPASGDGTGIMAAVPDEPVSEEGRREASPEIAADFKVVITVNPDAVLRLEEDRSAAFNPQTWDVTGNEVSFFVRDVLGSSPFRIRPGGGSGVADSGCTRGVVPFTYDFSGFTGITVTSLGRPAHGGLDTANGPLTSRVEVWIASAREVDQGSEYWDVDGPAPLLLGSFTYWRPQDNDADFAQDGHFSFESEVLDPIVFEPDVAGDPIRSSSPYSGASALAGVEAENLVLPLFSLVFPQVTLEEWATEFELNAESEELQKQLAALRVILEGLEGSEQARPQ